MKIPDDVVERVEAEQRPRESYGETLRRLLDEREAARRPQGAQEARETA